MRHTYTHRVCMYLCTWALFSKLLIKWICSPFCCATFRKLGHIKVILVQIILYNWIQFNFVDMDKENKYSCNNIQARSNKLCIHRLSDFENKQKVKWLWIMLPEMFHYPHGIEFIMNAKPIILHAVLYHLYVWNIVNSSFILEILGH